MTLTEMSQLFSCIKAKRDDIKRIEDKIRVDFEKNVVQFFKDKGFEFEKVDNKYDTISRYRLPKKEYPNFLLNWESTPASYFPPQFDIVPWQFTIKFCWAKAKNLNQTEMRWHPEEMSLEEFYNRKLKKVFVLL